MKPGAESLQARENDLQSEQEFKHCQFICFISQMGTLIKAFIYLYSNEFLTPKYEFYIHREQEVYRYSGLSKPGTAGWRPLSHSSHLLSTAVFELQQQK